MARADPYIALRHRLRADDRAADDSGVGACGGERADVLGRADTAGREHLRGRSRRPRRPARDRGRRAFRPGRSRCRGHADPRGEAELDRALGGQARSRSVQPAPRTMPSLMSSATTSCSPSASAQRAGSGKAAVPSTIRSAPASSSARASSSERMPPEAWSRAGPIASATVRTSSGRACPERAPSRSTRWMRGAPPRRSSRRARRDRPPRRRPGRSRLGEVAPRPRRGRRRQVSPGSASRASRSDRSRVAQWHVKRANIRTQMATIGEGRHSWRTRDLRGALRGDPGAGVAGRGGAVPAGPVHDRGAGGDGAQVGRGAPGGPGVAVPGGRPADARVDDDGDAGRALASPRRGRLPAGARPAEGGDVDRLTIAVPVKGRLREPSVSLLEDAGLGPEQPGERALAFPCRNAPVDVLLVRAADIPEYVQDGVVDCGITGQDLVRERGARVEELLELGFGSCRARGRGARGVSLPGARGSRRRDDRDRLSAALARAVAGRRRARRRDGSVEIAPRLGLAEGIVDLVPPGTRCARTDCAPSASCSRRRRC